MSTPVPPPIQTPPPTGGGGNVPTVTLSNPPSTVVALPASSTLQATVAAVQAGNQVQLATTHGALSGTTNVPLKVDSPLKLLILPQPPSAQTVTLQIVEVGGRPTVPTPGHAAPNPPGAPVPGVQGAPGQPPPATGAPSPAASTTVTLSAGQTVTAVLLPPRAPTGTPPGPTFQAPVGGTVPNQQGVPAAGSLPPTAPAIAPQTPAGRSPTTAPTNSPNPAGTTPTTPSAVPPAPGTRLTLGIVSLNPAPSSSTPAALTAAPLPAIGGTFTGLVIGSAPSGLPLVQTPVGQVALEQAPPLSKGAEIVFRLEATPEAPPQSDRIGGRENVNQLSRGHGWPALEELNAALTEKAPGLADRIAPLTTPQADAKLGTSLLFLLSALKAGDLKSWLGESGLRELTRLRPDTVRRLGDDVRLLAGADDADSRPVRAVDWRALPLPLFGEGMDQSRLLVRRNQQDDDAVDRDRSKETRFVVDLTLTSIGRLQLDGLIDTDSRRFDMLVRTTSTLPPRFRNDILRIFAAANETIGMSGGLAFRATPDALIDTTELQQPQARDGGLVV